MLSGLIYIYVFHAIIQISWGPINLEMPQNLFERRICTQDPYGQPKDENPKYNNGLDSPHSISLGDLQVTRAREQD